MANAKNVSLIFYIASRLKTVRFVNPNEQTKVRFPKHVKKDVYSLFFELVKMLTLLLVFDGL